MLGGLFEDCLPSSCHSGSISNLDEGQEIVFAELSSSRKLLRRLSSRFASSSSSTSSINKKKKKGGKKDKQQQNNDDDAPEDAIKCVEADWSLHYQKSTVDDSQHSGSYRGRLLHLLRPSSRSSSPFRWRSEAKILAMTWNMGGMSGRERIEKAMQTFFETIGKRTTDQSSKSDLYIIALQECVALTETRQAIQKILGKEITTL